MRWDQDARVRALFEGYRGFDAWLVKRVAVACARREGAPAVEVIHFLRARRMLGDRDGWRDTLRLTLRGNFGGA